MRARALLLACVAAGVVWWAWQDRGTSPVSDPDPTPVQTPEQDAPALIGSESRAPQQRLDIGGRVVAQDGSPRRGVSVTAQQQGARVILRTLTTADGRFRLRGLEPGLYRVRAVEREGLNPGLVTEGWARAGVMDLTLTLQGPSENLRVRVVGPGGRPVERFEARLLLPSGYEALGVQHKRLVIKGGPDKWARGMLEVWAFRDEKDHGLGYAPVRIGPLDRNQRELEVRVAEGPMLEGVVYGPEGRLEGIELSLSPRKHWWEQDDPFDRNEKPPPATAGALPHKLPFEGLVTKVRSDRDGRFRVAFLRPAVVHELAIKTPEEFHWIRRREVSAGDGPLEIRLTRHVAARVTVLGPDDAPVRDARVVAVALRSNGFWGGPRAQTDEQGVALLERLDPARQYKLVVNPNYDYSIDRTPSEWRKEKPTRSLSLAEQALEPWAPRETTVRLRRGFVLSGRVLDTDNRPVADRHVGMCNRVGFGVYTTASDGRFEFRGLPPGKVYLGLDDGGDSAGIVDRQRATMWEACFGKGKPQDLDASPYVSVWTALDLESETADVTLRVAKTISARLVLPAHPAGADHSGRKRFESDARAHDAADEGRVGACPQSPAALLGT